MPWESPTETAKKIRKLLQEKFPDQCFKVHTRRGSLDSAIDVHWEDGVSYEKVEPLVDRFSKVDRDEVSGEILGGGNRFVFAKREVSESHRKQVEDELWKRYASGTFYSKNDARFQDEVYRELRKRDLPTRCRMRR